MTIPTQLSVHIFFDHKICMTQGVLLSRMQVLISRSLEPLLSHRYGALNSRKTNEEVGSFKIFIVKKMLHLRIYVL